VAGGGKPGSDGIRDGVAQIFTPENGNILNAV
jgi:hypothetical protein